MMWFGLKKRIEAMENRIAALQLMYVPLRTELDALKASGKDSGFVGVVRMARLMRWMKRNQKNGTVAMGFNSICRHAKVGKEVLTAAIASGYVRQAGFGLYRIG